MRSSSKAGDADLEGLTLGTTRFSVVDVETTGFAPLSGDRIIEIAIVQLAADGSIEDEYVTLVNPLRDVGPTYVHGLTNEDVEVAPAFIEIVGDVLKRLNGTVSYLARIVSNLGAMTTDDERLAPYADLLDRVLEDLRVTQEEAAQLAAVAASWRLSREEVMSVHLAYLSALVDAAQADGVVTEVERRELETVTRLLAIDPSILRALLTADR